MGLVGSRLGLVRVGRVSREVKTIAGGKWRDGWVMRDMMPDSLMLDICVPVYRR